MERLTTTGLMIPDLVPWGTHLCQFYETKDDLFDVLVPFFRQGLAANEACLWITFDPISIAEATSALAAAVPDVNQYLTSGQLEIVSYDDWYLLDGTFHIDAVLRACCKKAETSLSQGYRGFRISGNGAGLKSSHWDDLITYEEKVQSALHTQRILALCSYPLTECSASEFLHLANVHDCTLARRRGVWECHESKSGRQLLKRLHLKEHAIASSISPMVMTDLAGRLTYANPAAIMAWRIEDESQVLGRPAGDFWEDPQGLAAHLERIRDTGSAVGEFTAKRHDGSTFEAEITGTLTFDDHGQPIGIVASMLDVTARKEAEARRRESQQRYQTLVENVALGITLMDRHRNILAINRVHANMIGRAVEQCLGQECFRIFEKRDVVCPYCPGTRAMEQGRPAEVETTGVRDDGTAYAARVQAFPVFGSEREVTGFIEVVEDITDRKRLEESLRLSKFCIEQAGDCILWIDPDGRVVFANQQACEVLEYSGDELTSMTVFDFDVNMTPAQWRLHWEAIRARKSFVVESCHRTSTGRVFPVEVSVNHMTYDGKEYNCAFGRDISDRKLAEKQLAHFSAIVNSTRDAIIGISLEGIATSWNPGAELLYGYTADEMIGQSLQNILPADRYDETSRLLVRLRQGECAEHLDTVRRKKDGTLVDVSLTLSPIKNSNGEILGASAIAHEITERKRTQRELVDAKMAAETANQAKSQFLANMSHEIRTPMMAILGFSDILLEKTADQETTEVCQIIKRNGEHLLHVINDILDLSKIEAGKFELDFLACSPRQLVADVVSTMRVRADAKGLQLSAEYRGAIPEMVQTDPLRLRQILVNLLGNAIKFTEMGSVRVVVHSDVASGEEGTLRFDIHDTGIGIAESHTAKLFRPFSQVDGSAHRQFGGTGLGLAISRRLARALGGDITVTSVLGKGATFTVTITMKPLTEAASPHPLAVPEEQNRLTTRNSSLLNCRVLLAEDGPDNQRLIAFLLRKAGAEVSLVENGQKAVEQVVREGKAGCSFDVILMDMQMPVMDGYEATRTLRNLGRTEPVIALTAHAMKEDRQKCLDAGCDDYLAKPVKREALIQLIEKYADRRPRARQVTSS